MLGLEIEPMNGVIAAYEKIAPDYEGILGSIYQFAPRQIDGFFSLLPKAAEVLDAGCGPGFESAVGTRHGLAMTGLDACEPMLLRFRENVPSGKMLAGSVTSIPAASESFDALFSSCVLLHLNRASAEAALLEFNRVLKPGGEFLIITSVHHGEEEWFSKPALSAAGVEGLYFHNWEKDALLAAAAAAGFSVAAYEIIQIKPARPALIFIRGSKSRRGASSTVTAC